MPSLMSLPLMLLINRQDGQDEEAEFGDDLFDSDDEIGPGMKSSSETSVTQKTDVLASPALLKATLGDQASDAVAVSAGVSSAIFDDQSPAKEEKVGKSEEEEERRRRRKKKKKK